MDIFGRKCQEHIFQHVLEQQPRDREPRLDAYKDIGVCANKETEPNEGREHGVLMVCSAFLSVFSVVKNRRQATGHLLKIV